MTQRGWLPLAVCGLTFFVVSCGSNPKPQTPAPPTPAGQSSEDQAPPPAPADPVAALIEKSLRHFVAGERELNIGHLGQARTEFDLAIDALLESPYGARTDSRLREHFDRLVDRINAYEVTALAQGDGFTEKGYEPALIDEILTIATFPKPAAGAGTAETVKADLEATEHDVPIPQNSRVLSYVELFQGRLRDYIEESLTRGTKYLPMIQSVFRAEGLPLDLAYIPIIESGFKTNALSKASAKGPWQFMKATGVEQGLKHDWYIDERSDPEKSTIAAAKYLKVLHKMFNGDWHLVLAAYNGGMGRVQRAMKASGLDDFWHLSRTQRFLPRETREYVPLILAAIIVARNPAQYGFDIVAEEPVAYEKVVVPRPIDLRRVAEWTDTSIDEIQALNPELRRWTTPVKYPEYELKVPVGTAGPIQERIHAASPAELGSLNWYTVRRGESLATVARKHGVRQIDLAEANHLSLRSTVRAGQELVIPRQPPRVLASSAKPAPPTTVAARAISGTAAVAETRQPTTRTITYRVKSGDTLFHIARLFDTTVDQIKALNRLRGSLIVPGDRLTIIAPR